MEPRKRSLRNIGIVLIVVGVIIPFLYFKEYRNWLTGEVTGYDFPLLPYGFALVIIGIFLIVWSVLIKEETCLPKPPPPPARCPYCRQVLPEGVKYCPYCGKALS